MTKLLPILVALGFKTENTALFFVIFIVAIALFAVLYHFLKLSSKDQKLMNNEISHINEKLGNHITDLKAGQKELKIDNKELKRELKADNKELKTELKADISRLESKIDKILSK